jgi:hypothetical protein
MLDITGLKQEHVKDVKSFKKCIVSLVDKFRFSYNIIITSSDDTITYSICHKRSPIPLEIGEFKFDACYKILKY